MTVKTKDRKTLQRAASDVVRGARWEQGRGGERFCAALGPPLAQVWADR